MTDLHKPAFAQLDQMPLVFELLQKSAAYTNLEPSIERILPLELRAHVRFVSIDGQKIRFLADSPAWATKLRLLSNEMIEHAKNLGHHHVKLLTVRVKRFG